MKKYLAVMIMAVLLLGMMPNANAITIDVNNLVPPVSLPVDPNPEVYDWGWIGLNNSNAEIMAIVAGLLPGYTELYKKNAGGSEEGSLAGSYSSSLIPDSNSATIFYDGGPYVSPSPVPYVIVKDGNADPNWYLIKLTGWDGISQIDLINFFLDFDGDGPYKNGSISHVSLLGYTNQVPEPATLILLGLGLLGIAGIRRRK